MFEHGSTQKLQQWSLLPSRCRNPPTRSVHLAAVGRHLGVQLSLDDWQTYSHRVPLLAGGYQYPVSQTPWQEPQRGLVGPLATGAILEGAEKYQKIDRTFGIPRDNH
jgi:hypothetical protein